MFEILLNAVKLAISKDARVGAKSIVSVFSKSPHWRKDICTIEARVTISERERLHFLEDLIVDKLHDMSYQTETCQRFRVVFRELVDNVFQHACKDDEKKPVRVSTNTSPTYVSLTVYNPKGSHVDLTSWLQAATLHLRESKKKSRGRGLLLAARKADTLEQVKTKAVKATLYRDAVRIEKVNLDYSTVVIVLSGHSNPSVGRRLTDYIEALDAFRVILCLDPKEMYEGDTARLIAETGKSLPRALTMEKDAELEREARLEMEELALCDSQILRSTVKALEKFAEIRSKESKQLVRLVCSDDDVADLLPKDIVSLSVAQAYRDLKNGGD